MRMIDADRLKDAIYTDFWEHFTQCHDSDQTALIDMVMYDIDEMPTLTPQNEPLTIEQLREMDGVPIYVITEKRGSGWCILSWHGVKKSYTYFSRTGTSEGMTATPLSAKTYGDLWLAYRRPPEGGCEIKDYAETCEECRFCDTTLERPPEGEERHMTNADKIRAMSDEELAKLMANSCPCVYPDCNGYRDYSDDSCIKHLLEWLQQQAEED